MSTPPKPVYLASEPPGPPPPSATVDFKTSDTTAPIVIVVISVILGIVIYFVRVQVYTKLKVDKRGTWDDLMCAIGVLSIMAFYVMLNLQLTEGDYGKHIWDSPLVVTTSDQYFKISHVDGWISILSYIFAKITFFLLYLQLFRPFRWLKIGIIGGAIIVTGVYAGFLLANLIGQTLHRGQTWLDDFESQHYTSGLKLSMPLAAWTLVPDVYILVLPITGVLRLQLSPRRKVAVSIVFMTGIGACICFSLSLYYRTKVNMSDVSPSVVNVEIIALVELCVGLFISCMPALSRMLRRSLPPYETLRSKLFSRASRLRGKLSGKSSPGESNNHAVKVDAGNGTYEALEVPFFLQASLRQECEPKQLESVKTKFATGDSHDLSDDTIHLRVDLEQGYAKWW